MTESPESSKYSKNVSPTSKPNENDKRAQNLAEGYTNILIDIDLDKQRKLLENEIMQINHQLDKTPNSIDQACVNNRLVYEEKMPRVFSHFQSVLRIFQSVDQLEAIVGDIKEDLNQLEDGVARAEKDLKIGPNISQVFKPLLFKMDTQSTLADGVSRDVHFIAPAFKFSPQNYFPPDEGESS